MCQRQQNGTHTMERDLEDWTRSHVAEIRGRGQQREITDANGLWLVVSIFFFAHFLKALSFCSLFLRGFV